MGWVLGWRLPLLEGLLPGPEGLAATGTLAFPGVGGATCLRFHFLRGFLLTRWTRARSQFEFCGGFLRWVAAGGRIHPEANSVGLFLWPPKHFCARMCRSCPHFSWQAMRSPFSFLAAAGQRRDISLELMRCPLGQPHCCFVGLTCLKLPPSQPLRSQWAVRGGGGGTLLLPQAGGLVFAPGHQGLGTQLGSGLWQGFPPSPLLLFVACRTKTAFLEKTWQRSFPFQWQIVCLGFPPLLRLLSRRGRGGEGLLAAPLPGWLLPREGVP